MKVEILAEKYVKNSEGYVQAFRLDGNDEIFVTWGLGLKDGDEIELSTVWEHPYSVIEFDSNKDAIEYVNAY